MPIPKPSGSFREKINDKQPPVETLSTGGYDLRIHPSLITLPVEWEFTVPYGLLYSPNISGEAAEFLNTLKEAIAAT